MAEHVAFGRWLKQQRHRLDLTQEELAEQAGCAAETIRKLEAGGRRPSKVIAHALADALQLADEERAAFLRLARPQPLPPPTSGEGELAPTARNDPPPAAASEAISEQQTAPLLATKIYLPRSAVRVVARPRLIARLEAGRAGRLTLIAAPAGFGKTTILADWLRREDALSLRVAWLALDLGDSDPLRFLRYLIAALRTIAPAAGATATNLLRSAQAPSIQTVMPLLVNDLVRLPEQSVLVLDDYHVIESPAIHQALQFLLDHLPPQLHLVIASRADPPLPLARLRARGQLTELRAYDLRFTSEEAALFLREVMGVPLTAEEVAALEERTEGWIAGLQLAALSLRDRSDEQRTQFIDAFSGSNRFVMDFLVDEVLARQPAHLQTFLLQTSILERLCGPLCDAVLGITTHEAPPVAHGAYSQLVLEELERANLFIMPLDEARRWYRYHHLFAQLLRDRLANGANVDTVATLHCRASSWYERQGLILEAVHHALAAQDWQRTARLIEEHGMLLILRGHVHTVLGWLSMLPATLSHGNPVLSVIHATGRFCVNELDAAESSLLAAEEALQGKEYDDQARATSGTVAFLRANIARTRGDLGRWFTLARDALNIYVAGNIPVRPAVELAIACAFVVTGDVSPASERRLTAAIPAVRASGDLMTLLHGGVSLAELRRRQGRLRQAAATFREAAQVASDPTALRTMIDGAAYYFGLGDVLREWNQLDDAEQQLVQGREMLQGTMVMRAETISLGYVALARLHQARGELDAAKAMLHEFEQLARKLSYVDGMLARIAAAQTEVALRQGNLHAAVQWADRSGLSADDELSYPREPEYLAMARVRIAQQRSNPDGAYLDEVHPLLDRLLEAAEAGSRMESMIEIRVLRALAMHLQDDLPAALVEIKRALMLAAPEGYVRRFVDEGAPMAVLLAQALRTNGWGVTKGMPDSDPGAYAATLLGVLHGEGIETGVVSQHRDPNSQSPAHDIEQLTDRELQVLALLARGCSNRAIASELVVAVGTVKRHVNSITGKLQVQNRLEAVARARELGLV